MAETPQKPAGSTITATPAIESSAEKIARLERENAALLAKFQAAEETIQQKDAQAAAQMQFGSTAQEFPAGTKKVKRLDEDGDPVTRRVQKLDGDGKHELDDDGKPMFVKEPIYDDVAVYRYKIDIPPSGGVAIMLNGVQYYHGEVYEFDVGQLRTIKDIVARSWGHEANIRGAENENAYRQPKSVTLRGNERRRA